MHRQVLHALIMQQQAEASMGRKPNTGAADMLHELLSSSTSILPSNRAAQMLSEHAWRLLVDGKIFGGQ